MPRVPTYGLPRVEPAARPGVRVGTDVPLAAVDVPTALDLSGPMRQMAQLVEEERQRADELAVLEATTQLAALEQELLHDPERGALQRRGKEAFEIPKAVGEAWEKRAAEIGGALTSEPQRQAFARARAARWQAVNGTVQRHVAGERERYDSEQTEAAIALALTAGLDHYQDAERRDQELAGAEHLVRRHADRTGKPAEWTEQRVAQLRNQHHGGIIQRLVDERQADAARAYLEQYGEQMTGQTRAAAEQLVQRGTLEERVFAEADAIYASARSRQDAYDRANRLPADIRAQVRSELRTRFGDDDRAEADRYQAVLERMADIVERGGTLTPSQRQQLKASDRRVLDSWAERAARDEPIRTDWSAYYDLLSAANDPALMDDFAEENLLAYRLLLGDTEWKELTRIQQRLRRGEGPEEGTQRGVMTERQIIDSVLDGMGVVDRRARPGTAQAERAGQLLRTIDGMVAAEKQAKGRGRLSAEELEAIVRRATTEAVISSGSWWRRDQRVPVGALTPEQRQAGRVAFRQIPQTEIMQLHQAANDIGLGALTDADMERIYFRLLVNGLTAETLMRADQATKRRILLGEQASAPDDRSTPATSAPARAEPRAGAATNLLTTPGGRG